MLVVALWNGCVTLTLICSRGGVAACCGRLLKTVLAFWDRDAGEFVIDD